MFAALLVPAPPTLPPHPFVLDPPFHVGTFVDPNLPPLTRITPIGGVPACPAEFGPLSGIAMFDTGAQSNHYVNPSLVSQLQALKSNVAVNMGFCLRSLDPPVTRIAAGALVTFTQAAVIPFRFFGLLLSDDLSTFSPLEKGSETDEYFVLPPLPQEVEYPFSVMLSSPSPGSVVGGDRWPTLLRLELEKGTVYSPLRQFPSLTSTEPPTLLQLVRRLGVSVDLPSDDSDSEEEVSLLANSSSLLGLPSSAPSSLTSSVSSKIDTSAPPSSSAASVPATAPPRGRSLLRVGFLTSPSDTVHVAGAGARPLSSPPLVRRSRSRSSSADSSVDFAGCPDDLSSLPYFPPPPESSTLTDSDIRSRFAWDFITQNGKYPELAAQVWDIVSEPLRIVFGPIPRTEDLPVVVDVPLREL